MGRILVDGTGRTLYVFQADSGATSRCFGSCAKPWPPDTTTGRPIPAPPWILTFAQVRGVHLL
ncbi:hypothetical protein ACWCRD_35155 [Streptomyces sp. NPDC002092]